MFAPVSSPSVAPATNKSSASTIAAPRPAGRYLSVKINAGNGFAVQVERGWLFERDELGDAAGGPGTEGAPHGKVPGDDDLARGIAGHLLQCKVSRGG